MIKYTLDIWQHKFGRYLVLLYKHLYSSAGILSVGLQFQPIFCYCHWGPWCNPGHVLSYSSIVFFLLSFSPPHVTLILGCLSPSCEIVFLMGLQAISCFHPSFCPDPGPVLHSQNSAPTGRFIACFSACNAQTEQNLCVRLFCCVYVEEPQCLQWHSKWRRFC